MVLGLHLIFTAYGFWLPNDPRGSWSDCVRSWELLRFGKATTTNTRASLAAAPHVRSEREDAKELLKYPPVHFDGKAAAAIGYGFADACEDAGYIIHACAILPEHVHLVLARHDRDAKKIIGHFKARATRRMNTHGVNPMQRFGADHSPWANRGWVVFLSTDEALQHAIAYVEQNPVKEGKPKQDWSFVTPYHPI
jgi:REP-associated tyrosine transposase